LRKRGRERKRFEVFKERMGEEEVRVFQRQVGRARGRGRGYHLPKRVWERQRLLFAKERLGEVEVEVGKGRGLGFPKRERGSRMTSDISKCNYIKPFTNQ